MGLISYIKKERERKFRASLLPYLPVHYATAEIIFRFINGEDNALKELPESREFYEWKRIQQIKESFKSDKD